MVVVHAFNPSTWEAGSSRPALTTELSSRIAKATQRNPVWKKKTNKNKTKKDSHLSTTFNIICLQVPEVYIYLFIEKHYTPCLLFMFYIGKHTG